MFKDIELKINYHKEKIIQSFIKRGIYPNNSLIQTQLNNIDFPIAVL